MSVKSCVCVVQWSGIILNWYSDVAGLKFKVEHSANIRRHFEVGKNML